MLCMFERYCHCFCQLLAGLGVEDTWYSATLWTNPSQRHSGMARIFKGSHSFTCHLRIYWYPRMEWTIPAFAFPAEAGPHLPTPEGWKAELAQALPWWVNSLPGTAM